MKKPNQIYVTARKQPVYGEYDRLTGSRAIEGYNADLGFVHIWNPKKPDDKKHATQRQWAIDGGYSSIPELRADGFWWFTERTARYGPTGHNVVTYIDKKMDPQPQLYDNIPLNGFKIVESVSRYSTSNKVWRILDPRGFETEISTACLENIIQNSAIEKGGLIVEKCYWYSNKNLKVAE